MVGLTEPQERERAEIEGFEISVAKTSFKANTKALAENEGEGLAKHWVVQALNVDTGANHSAEGVKEQPAFDKKQFVAFVKKYIKPLSATSGGSVGLMVLISQAVYDGGRHVLGVIPKTLMPKESSVLHSQPKSTVGTPAYIAPEVLLRQECDGKDQFDLIADSNTIRNDLIPHMVYGRNVRDQEFACHNYFSAALF